MSQCKAVFFYTFGKINNFQFNYAPGTWNIASIPLAMICQAQAALRSWIACIDYTAALYGRT